MGHLGTWVSSGLGSAGGLSGLDLKRLFLTQMILWFYKRNTELDLIVVPELWSTTGQIYLSAS